MDFQDYLRSNMEGGQRVTEEGQPSVFVNVESVMKELATPALQNSIWRNPNEFGDLTFVFNILFDDFNLREWDPADLTAFNSRQRSAVLRTMDLLDELDEVHGQISDRETFQAAMLADPRWSEVVSEAREFFDQN